MMDTPQDEQEAERLRKEAVVKAFAILERNPEFSAVQVEIHERDQEIEMEKVIKEGAPYFKIAVLRRFLSY